MRTFGPDTTPSTIQGTGVCGRAGAGLLLMLVFGLAIALRLREAAHPMTYDEFASLYFADQPFQHLWGWWMVRETNPPLFYSILKVWRLLVPSTQAGLRLLPCVLSLGQIALLAGFTKRTYGWLSAVLCVLLLALSPSDIFQSEYVRGYVLAKLAVTVSFIGLVAALRRRDRLTLGWVGYTTGAVVAIYCHTTMLIWPAIATTAVLIDAVLTRRLRCVPFTPLATANLAIGVSSAWAIALAVAQLQTRTQNIAWIEPLPVADYASSLNLQLLMDGISSSALMGFMMIVGAFRTWAQPETRLALIMAAMTVFLFKAADAVHPIVSDYTLHWAAIFTTLLAAAAVASFPSNTPGGTRRLLEIGAGLSLLGVLASGLYELLTNVWLPVPQDWRYTVRTVANTPGAGLLVSHESVGLVVKQACMLEFHAPSCPFRVVVMENPARSDSWAAGGYGSPLTPITKTASALAGLKNVYAFSRYLYTPLAPLGLDPGDYREVQWDDGELIGPISTDDFVSSD